MTMRPGLIVVDDFLTDPFQARATALSMKFQESASYKGHRSTECGARTSEIHEKLCSLLRSEVRYSGSSFMYHWSPAGTPEVYHSDGVLGGWGGVLYLKPDAPLESGTSLFRHKASGAMAGDPARFSTQPAPFRYLDPTEYVETDFTGNVFNRLVLFPADRLHSMRRPFGHSAETARLTQLFFLCP